MIIKSMSRKKPSFAQLLKYMSKGADEEFIYTRNLYSLNAEGIIQEFKENFSFLRRQKNSNALYHEVIAFTKAKGISIKDQKEKIIEAVEEYMKTRAKDCLVYGRIHEAENNLHIHLMFSSNAIEQSKNHYLSQKQFDKVKVDFEKYVLKKYPELEQKPILTKNREKKKEGVMSQKEFEVKKRTGKITKKESMQYRLTQIFNCSPTKEIFFENLRSNNIEIYVRGKKTIGFKDLGDNKRPYRLNTLGLSQEFNKMSEVLAQELKAEKEKFKKPSPSKRREAPKQGEEEPKAKGKEQEALDEIREYRKNMSGGSKSKKKWQVETVVEETKEEAEKVFSGIKRLVGLDSFFKKKDNNPNDMVSNRKPEWEREDGTIDREKQAEALRAIELHRITVQGLQKEGKKKKY